MLYLILLLIVCMVILLFRYLYIRKEMNKMTNELKRIHSEQTNEFLQINLGDQAVEKLATEINKQIEEKQEVRRSAIRAEQELTGMITGMSHDLRTPLTAIIGYVQLLEDPHITPEERTYYLSVVHGRANQLHALIQSFFALSAIQSDEEKLNVERVNIQEVIQSSVLPFYDLFQEAEKNVDFTLPEKPLFVMGDLVASRRIIENIVLNALQHAGNYVGVTVEATEAEVTFIVQNTMKSGVTLDEKRLFNRLYTGDKTRKHHRGLGLPIVDRLMKQMDGHVEASAEEGIFTIRCTWNR